MREGYGFPSGNQFFIVRFAHGLWLSHIVFNDRTTPSPSGALTRGGEEIRGLVDGVTLEKMGFQPSLCRVPIYNRAASAAHRPAPRIPHPEISKFSQRGHAVMRLTPEYRSSLRPWYLADDFPYKCSSSPHPLCGSSPGISSPFSSFSSCTIVQPPSRLRRQPPELRGAWRGAFPILTPY